MPPTSLAEPCEGSFFAPHPAADRRAGIGTINFNLPLPCRPLRGIIIATRARSSVGRVLHSHCRGRGFDSLRVHQKPISFEIGFFLFARLGPHFLLSVIPPQCTISRKPGGQNKNPPCRFKASGDWHLWQYFLWYAWIPDQLLKGQVFCKGFGSVDLSQVKLNIKAGACLCTVIDNIRDGQNFICPLKNIARRRKVILQKVVVNLLGDLKSGFRQCAHIFCCARHSILK